VTGMSLVTSPGSQTSQDGHMDHPPGGQTKTTGKRQDYARRPGAGPLIGDQDLLTDTEDLMRSYRDLLTREDQLKGPKDPQVIDMTDPQEEVILKQVPEILKQHALMVRKDLAEVADLTKLISRKNPPTPQDLQKNIQASCL